MDAYELSGMLFGHKRAESDASERLRDLTISGVAESDSADGLVSISLDGDLTQAEDDGLEHDHTILIPTEVGVYTGDEVAVTLTGADLSTLRVTGVVGDGDRVNARISGIEADYVKATELEADVADIGFLKADSAVITNIQADTAKVHNLTAQEISSATGYVADLEAGNVTAQQLVTDHAKVGQLDVDQIAADHATIGTLDTTYMHADMANADVAWIQNGTIKDGAIVSAMINDVSANKLTAGTINGSVINVTNLNADNITTGTINGQRIGEGSLSLDKLSEDVYTEAEVNNIVDGLNDRIDGAIETFTGTAVPTLNNSPASSWNTTKLRDEHVGDVYYVVNPQSQQNGYCYRFTKSGSTYSWQLIKDSDVTAALSRLTTAEGKITTFDSDISQLKTDTGTLTTKTESLETRMSDAESDILDKVDTTTFNEVSDTVDQHSQTIAQHTTAISNKADGSTVTALTNRVSKNEQDISGISTTLGELQDTVESKADGSTVSTISNKLNTVSDTVDGHTQTLTSVQNTLSSKADSSTVSTLTTKVNNVSDTVDGHTQTISSQSTILSNNGLTSGTNITSRVTTAESNITQNANNIALKVSESDVTGNYLVGKINLNSTTASIAAEHINLQGAVTISDLSSDAQSATLNSNIVGGGANLIGGFNKTYISNASYDHLTGKMTSLTTTNTSDNSVYVQFYRGTTKSSVGTFVRQLDALGSSANVGQMLHATFEKASDFTHIRFKFNGNKADAGVIWDVSSIEDGTKLSLSCRLDSISSDGKGNGGVLSEINLRRGNAVSAWSLAPQDEVVGGRNLLAKTKELTSGVWVYDGATRGDNVAQIATSDKRIYQLPSVGYWTWTNDTTYAVSVDARADASTVLEINAVGASPSGMKKQFTVGTSWERYVFVFTVTNGNTGSLSFYRKGSASTTLYLRRPKLEEGNKATDWSPAPEDVDSAISDAAKTATSYVTDITGGGIMVHPSGDQTTGVKVTDDVDIMRGGTSVINIGTNDAIRIGAADNVQMLIESDGLEIDNEVGDKIFGIESSSSGSTTVTTTLVTWSTTASVDTTARTVSDSTTAAGEPIVTATVNGTDYTLESTHVTTTVTAGTGVTVALTSDGVSYVRDLMVIEVDEDGAETIAPCELSVEYQRAVTDVATLDFSGKQVVHGSGVGMLFTNDEWTNDNRVDTYFEARNETTGAAVYFGVGSGGQNRGIWDSVAGSWLINRTASNDTVINGPKFSVAASGNVKSTYQVRVTGNGTTAETQKRIALRSNNVGNRGLFDESLNKWMLYRSLAGNDHLAGGKWYFDDPYNTSTSLKLGDPQRLMSSGSYKAGTSDTMGPYVTLTAGKWLVTGNWSFTNTSSNAKRLVVGLYRSSDSQAYTYRVHTTASSSSAHRLEVVDTIVVSAASDTVTLYASSSPASTSASTQYIVAIRLA